MEDGVRVKIICVILMGVLLSACSHYKSKKIETSGIVETERNIASKDSSAAGEGSSFLRKCMGDLEKEFDSEEISKKYSVKF